jgi:hypothetical protein
MAELAVGATDVHCTVAGANSSLDDCEHALVWSPMAEVDDADEQCTQFLEIGPG